MTEKERLKAIDNFVEDYFEHFHNCDCPIEEMIDAGFERNFFANAHYKMWDIVEELIKDEKKFNDFNQILLAVGLFKLASCLKKCDNSNFFLDKWKN